MSTWCWKCESEATSVILISHFQLHWIRNKHGKFSACMGLTRRAATARRSNRGNHTFSGALPSSVTGTSLQLNTWLVLSSVTGRASGFHQTWSYLSLGRNGALALPLVEPHRSWGVVGSAAGGLGSGGWGKLGVAEAWEKYEKKTVCMVPLMSSWSMFHQLF